MTSHESLSSVFTYLLGFIRFSAPDLVPLYFPIPHFYFPTLPQVYSKLSHFLIFFFLLLEHSLCCDFSISFFLSLYILSLTSALWFQ